MLRKILSFTALFVFSTLHAQAQSAHPDLTDIQRILQKNQLPTHALALVALPLSKGSTNKGTFYNANTSVNPASVIKLVTTYAALENLGPSFTWQTDLLTDGKIEGNQLNGNLYFRSGGDPKLTIERLWLLLRNLKLQGIQHINGDLVLDGSFYQIESLKAFDGEKSDLYRPFMVDGNSLLVNFNAQRFIVTGSLTGATVTSDPFIPDVMVDNQVRVVPPQNCNAHTKVYFHPLQTDDSLTLRVTGSIPEGCSTQKYFAFMEHERYAAGIIRSTWEDMGGTISGGTVFAVTPRSARRLSSLPSISVAEAIRDVNKYSNNAMAKQLFLTIGARNRLAADTDDAEAAKRVVIEWWKSKGILRPSLIIENGSGLSRSERLSAYELALMLKDAASSPYAAEFQASLPLVAIDGTMSRRLRRSPIAGQARIKTGTLRNVRAIAGYSNDKNGDPWVIVAILNHPVNIHNGILDTLLNSLHLQTPIR